MSRAYDRTKLAVWAQEYIALLEHRLAERDAKIRELTSEYPDTNVKVSGNYIYPDRTLPLNSQVAFKLNDDDYSYIKVRHDLNHEGFLHVMGSGQILVKSVCSNVVEIGVCSDNRL